MERNERNNGNTVLLTVIGVATLLVALVGATFAYFSATITNNGSQSVTVQTATATALVFAGGTATLPNAMPGDKTTDGDFTFTVTYPASTDGKKYTTTYYYDLYLVVDSNDFEVGTTEASKDQLEVSVKSNAGTFSEQKFNVTDSTTGKTGEVKADGLLIASNIAIAPASDGSAVVQTYTVNINFKETNENQDENQDKSFVGHIEARNVTSKNPNPSA